MSTVAIIAVEDMDAGNAIMEENGQGPRNFQVPAYINGAPRYAALHCWNDPDFLAALALVPTAIVQDGPLEISPGVFTDDPIVRTNALIEAQGAVWGAQSPPLPDTGIVTAGEMYTYGGELWYIIQTFDRTTFNLPPETYPALMRVARDPYTVSEWRQPIDQYDAYKLENPFTSAPDRCYHNGSEWYVSQADGAGNNTWEPGVFGWTEVI